jgi:hypothetical protein
METLIIKPSKVRNKPIFRYANGNIDIPAQPPRKLVSIAAMADHCGGDQQLTRRAFRDVSSVHLGRAVGTLNASTGCKRSQEAFLALWLPYSRTGKNPSDVSEIESGSLQI